MNRQKFLNHWWFEEYRFSAEGLGLYRIAYVFFILFIYGLPDFSWIATQPDYYYFPRLLSIGAFWAKFPAMEVFVVLQGLIALGYALLLVGWQTRKVSIILPLMVIFCKTFAYAFGHLDHDIFAWVVPLIMSGSCWGDAYSVDAYRQKGKPSGPNTGWPIHLIALLLSVAMFLAAMPKTIGGWFDASNQAVLAHFNYNYYVVGRHDLLATPFLGIKSLAFWEFMDWSAVLFEFSFIVAMFRLGWFRLVIGVACIFHFLNMVMLNIPFTENIGAYLAFLPWNRIQGKIPPSIPKQWPPKMIAVSVAFCALCAIPAWIRQPEIRPVWMDAVQLSLLGLVGVLILGAALLRAVRNKPSGVNFT